MKQQQYLVQLIILNVLMFSSCSRQNDFPVLRGPYLGQKPPGMTPKIFAPGIICTHMDDWAIRFSPDGNEIYFTVTGKNQATLVSVKIKKGKWVGPEVMSFSGNYFDYAPAVNYDGNRFVFSSYRPLVPGEEKSDADLWLVHRIEDGWDAPRHISGVNTDGNNEVWPCFASNGDLYFASNRDGGHGNFDIYVSNYKDGVYQNPKNLGHPINSELGEYCPFISPDGSYLIFEVVDKPDGFGRGDMYISWKQSNGTWGKPTNMGETFNGSRNECYPCLSPDGQFFFFMSDRRKRTPRKSDQKLNYRDIVENAQKNGGWDIYWINAKTIEELKPAELLGE